MNRLLVNMHLFNFEEVLRDADEIINFCIILFYIR